MTSSLKTSGALRSAASGSASDLETAAKAALVEGSKTSEKTTDERLEDAKDEVVAAAARHEARAREQDADAGEDGADEGLRNAGEP